MSDLSAAEKAAIMLHLFTCLRALRCANVGVSEAVESFGGLKEGPAVEGLKRMRFEDDDQLGLRLLSAIDLVGAASKAVCDAFLPISALVQDLAQDAETVALYQEQMGMELSIEELPGTM